MNIGDNIKNRNDLFIYNIFKTSLDIFEITRKFDKNSFDLSTINYNDYDLQNKDYFIKIFTTKVTNFKKSGLQNLYNTNKDKNIIFIIDSISSKLYSEIIESYSNIEIFLITDIIHNPFNNVLQSKYELLSLEEIKQLRNDYNIYNSKLFPKIKKSDIITRCFNAKVDDIFKITRFNPLFGKDIYYRVVVNSNYDDMFN